MKVNRKFFATFFLLLTVSFASSGLAQEAHAAQGYTVQQIPLPLQPPASAASARLNGNWILAGDRERKIYPMLAVNLTVDGNWILGAARYDILCSHKIQRHFSSDLTLVGKIAPDGNFRLWPAGPLASDGQLISLSTPPEQTAIVIKGVAPHDGDNTWKGTFAFTIPSYKPLSDNPYGACTSPQTGSIEATPFAPLSGTYAGTISGEGLGNDVAVTINLSQSGPQVTSDPDGKPRLLTSPLFPLSATISVKGSPCFTHGTSRQPIDGNQLYGNRFDMNFDMEGVAVLMVDGWVAGQRSDTFRDVSFRVGLMGSKCFNAHATGVLKKQ